MTGVLVALAPTNGAAAQAAPEREPERIPGQWIVGLDESVDRPASATARLAEKQGFNPEDRYTHAIEGFSAELSPGQVDALRANPAVDFVVPDRELTAFDSMISGDFAPTGVRRVDAAEGTAVHPASSVNVAVIDTGIDLDHPDLNVAGGVNCLGAVPPDDDNGHGTHVAGSIAAENDGTGVVGVAPGTRLFAAKVLDSAGSGSTSTILCGIDWVTKTLTDTDPSNDISVVNMSLGGPGAPVKTCSTTTDPMHIAICKATALGATFVVAAGNNGWDFDYPQQPDLPAAYPEVLTVTAMTDSDGEPGALAPAPGCAPGEADERYASYSNFAATSAGAAHTVAAPGTCITSTFPGGRYAVTSGTSMAAPHVAGLVALCVGETEGTAPCANLTPAQIVQHIRSDAQARTSSTPAYGFYGDPLRPVSGRYYGYLSWTDPPSPDEPAPPADTTAPTVTSVTPPSGATGVSPLATVSASFDEPMDRPSTEAAFSLTRDSDGTRVPGTFTWVENTLTFKPSAPLTEGATYIARVSTEARDVAGNRLATAKEWSFRVLQNLTASPVSTTIVTGGLRSGNTQSLWYDDNRYLEINSTTKGTRTTFWYAYFRPVPNTVSDLRVTYKGKNSRTCTQDFFIYNWTSGGWTPLDTRSVGTTELQLEGTIAGAPADYVSGTSGDGDVVLGVQCRASANFVAYADWMRIRYIRP